MKTTPLPPLLEAKLRADVDRCEERVAYINQQIRDHETNDDWRWLQDELLNANAALAWAKHRLDRG